MEDHITSKVIVTGACGGIGEAIARAFAGAGAAVALADIRTAELAHLATVLTGQGATVYHEAVDVTEDAAVQALLRIGRRRSRRGQSARQHRGRR